MEAPARTANRVQFGITLFAPPTGLQQAPIIGAVVTNGVSTLPTPGDTTQVCRVPLRGSPTPADGGSEFVAGDENRLLAAVVQSWCGVLRSDGSPVGCDKWNRLASPLVLVGATGSGKSHLAAGLAEFAGEQIAAFTTANDLRREFADAIDAGDAQAWRNRLAGIPLLVLDDLDHLPSRSTFQTELLHLTRERETRGHKLLVTSNRPIAHLNGWLPDLVNWFASGLTLQIAPLGAATRRELVMQLADAKDWCLSAEAYETLTQRAPAEPRELLRLFTDLERQFGRGARFEADTLQHFLEKRRAAGAPDLREIVRMVARYHQLPLKQLTSASRKSAVVSARATAIYLARTLTTASYEQIGQLLGGRDHSTIMHSFRQTEKRIQRQAALRLAIDELTKLLRK